MPFVDDWKFASGKRHTQDGSQLVSLMKPIGHGLKPVLAVDVGAGDGIIAYDLLVHRKATWVLAVEIMPDAARAAAHNLDHYIEAGRAEVKRASAETIFRKKTYWDRFDRFVINPPFFPQGSGRPNKNAVDQAARHDARLSLKVWARGAKRLLKTGGELYCVFPTERLAELIMALSSNGVEPKELWWFKDDRRKRRFFLRAVRGAKSGLTVHADFGG